MSENNNINTPSQMGKMCEDVFLAHDVIFYNVTLVANKIRSGGFRVFKLERTRNEGVCKVGGG